MKWKYFALPYDDPKAKGHIFENLTMGAYEHTLSRKLRARFAAAAGSVLLVALESIDLDSEHLFKYGTYKAGNWDAVRAENADWTDFPRWGLVKFVGDWLRTSLDAVVLCENWAATRKDLLRCPRESRTACYRDEVYHILASEDARDDEAIECGLRESEHQWATAVCARCTEIPLGEIATETFFDNIVSTTSHIFTPALDGEGYLIWSPGDREE